MVIGKNVRFGPHVYCTGTVRLGDNVEVAANTLLTAYPGAHIEIGDGVFIGGGTLIAARKQITIGPDGLIAELVAIRDHDPAFAPRSGHMLVEGVRIGARVWIGAKASVVRGASIGDDAVIGAHAMVNRPVPAAALAAGVPARVVRENIRSSLATGEPQTGRAPTLTCALGGPPA